MVDVSIVIVRIAVLVPQAAEHVCGDSDHGVFGNEHAFIPVICSGAMCDSKRYTVQKSAWAKILSIRYIHPTDPQPFLHDAIDV